MKRLVLLFSCLWLAGCDSCGGSVKPLGDQVLGTYGLHGDGTSKSCSLPAIQATLDLSGTISRQSDGGQTYFYFSLATYDAGFDGQFFTSAPSGPQSIGFDDGGSCSPCTETQTMAFKLAILSPSQSKALGDMCPANPLDGGIPAEDPDAGIFRPTFTDAGFDGVRVCGELKVTIDGSGTGFCDAICLGCVLNYRVTGQRQ